MKIGVTGGTGFIGQYLLKQKQRENDFYIVMTSRQDVQEYYQSDNIEYICCEYEKEDVFDIFKECDAIVHLGAQRPVGKNKNRMEDYWESILFTERLFEFAYNNSILNIVNISSGSVYDQTLNLPYKEEFASCPQNCYGITKLCCEKLAHMYNRNYGMHIKSLRLGRVFGVGERKEFMPAVFLERCINNEVLTVKGNENSTKDYLYVKDAVNAIIKAYEHVNACGVYNISAGIETSNLELADMYCKVFSNPSGYCVEHLEGVRETRILMDISRAKAELGFEVEFTIESALIDMSKGIGQHKVI